MRSCFSFFFYLSDTVLNNWSQANFIKMIHTHTLLGACLLLASSYVSATCDLSEHPPPSCKSDDWMSGPNPTCSLHTIELDPDGGHRYAVVTFPPTWSLGQASNQSYPLLLSFHGRNRDAAEQQILTGFSDPQNNINAIVAYPQGTCVSLLTL